MHEIGLEKVCIWNGSSMEAHNNVLNCKPVHSVVQSKALAFSQTVNVPYTNVMLNTTLNAQSILLHYIHTFCACVYYHSVCTQETSCYE